LNEVSDDIGYITQDPHFIDYLTVLDNLKLCSMDDRLIDTLLAEFGLSEKKYSYPSTLSGGEKQRVAIIQALLGEKDILFFDEPTASLDKENKILIFKILEELKKSKLIICSSHDDEAIVYADEIIDFNDLSNIQTNSKINVNPAVIKTNKIQKKRKLQTYINKMYSYPGREKKSRIILIVVFIFTFFALCICDTPKNKTESNIKYTYHLNQIQVACHNVN
jgi:ABC-type lipoprotein export system ATPase subunit